MDTTEDSAEVPQLFTIIDAAKRLGVAAKRLRLFLAKPENNAHIETGQQPMQRGMRLVQMMPLPFPLSMDEWLEKERTRIVIPRGKDRFSPEQIQEILDDEAEFQERRRRITEGIDDDKEEYDEDEISEETSLPAVAYERMIAELIARVEDLRAALEHERQQSRVIAEALAREQVLLQSIVQSKVL